MHFVIPRSYQAIVPPRIAQWKQRVRGGQRRSPRSRAAWRCCPSAPRRGARWWLLATLAAVYPANIHMAVNSKDFAGHPGAAPCGPGCPCSSCSAGSPGAARARAAAPRGGVRPRDAESPPMVIVLGIDPGHREHGLRRGPLARAAARGARRRRDRDAAGRAARAAARAHPRARLRPDRRARAGGAGGRGPLLRPERAHRPSRSARRAAWCCCPPAWHGVPCFSYTPQAVKQAVCGSGCGRQGPGPADGRRAAVAARAAASPTTPPTRSPWPSATPTAPRLKAALGVIASVRGEVLVAPARPRRGRVRRASATGWPSPPRRCARCPAAGEEALLHTHLVMRDDGMHLYGFATEDERELFLMLIGVQGVGPEGRAGRALGRHAARAAERDRHRRRRALPGRARHRQAHRRADHRRAAREGRGQGRATRSSSSRAVRRPAHARARGPRGPRLQRRRRPTSCSTRRDGDTPEDLIAGALKAAPMSGGIRTPGVERIQDRGRARRPRRSSTARCARSGSRTSSASSAVKEQLGGLHRGRPRARRGARPRAARRAARPRQDLARADRRQRARGRRSCRPPARRSSARATSPRSSPRSSRAAVFFVDEIHRLPRALEETFYPGDGGPAAADHGRPGRGRARRHARPAAVHADRRHHARRACSPRRCATASASRTGSTSTTPDDLAAIVAPLGRHPRASRSTTAGAERDRRRARAAPRAWPTGCSSACATSPRCAAPATSTRAVAARGARPARGRRGRARPARPRDPARDLREVRRRPGGPVDARGRGLGGAGHARGRLRAVPAPAGPDQAHAARPRGHRGGLRAPGPRAAARRHAAPRSDCYAPG